jgi:preprotein translocase subunit YajC
MMGDKNGGGGGSLIFLLLIFVVFYFFMIRPQMKKQKDQKRFLTEIKKGDRIVTSSGIHGKVLEIQDTTFLIETEGGGRLKVEKAAISLEMSAALNKQQ